MPAAMLAVFLAGAAFMLMARATVSDWVAGYQIRCEQTSDEHRLDLCSTRRSVVTR